MRSFFKKKKKKDDYNLARVLNDLHPP